MEKKLLVSNLFIIILKLAGVNDKMRIILLILILINKYRFITDIFEY